MEGMHAQTLAVLSLKQVPSTRGTNPEGGVV